MSQSIICATPMTQPLVSFWWGTNQHSAVWEIRV